MEELIWGIGLKVKDSTITWEQATREFNDKTGQELSKEAFRNRFRKLEKKFGKINRTETENEYTTYSQDGTIDICKKVWFDKSEPKTPEYVLKKFGYDPNEWEIVTWTFGKWEVAIKDEEQNRECTTIRCKIKPKVKKELTNEQMIEVAQEVFSKSIKPLLRVKKEQDKTLDKNKLMELTGIELHLGKMAWNGDTGQDYDKDIAKDRFYHIVEEIEQYQDTEKCDTCLLCIGNDFFNSDTVNATTTKGTPQTNDLRWKKMFTIGLEMYTTMLETLRTRFNRIEVRLQSGNHDKMASFYLYMALSCYYKNDDIVQFSNDYKDVQCFEWGKCAIAFTHGDTNLKRLIKSIPVEFRESWAKCPFFELHLGHLHKEVVVDDDSGLITRRVGSPTGVDQWHYEERFIGATQKYQCFVWDKDKGLQNIKYINFESKKKLARHKK